MTLMTHPKIYTFTATLLGLRIFARNGTRMGEVEFQTASGKKHKAVFKSPDIFDNLSNLKKGSRAFLEVQAQKGHTTWLNTLTLP